MADELLIIDDEDRYARFRLIPWWRQEKLLSSRIMVVGAGALGNEVLKNLALLGVGKIFLVDYDTIDMSNLTRSVLYRAADAGRPKVEKAAQRTMDLNPDVRVRAFNGNVITDVGLGIFSEMDVVIGCLDNREARLWLNRQCWKVGKPWIDAAIQELMGTVKVFVPPSSACYECAMTEMDYKLINLKYSCPLLKRDDLLEGKVPTVTTIASIAAAYQVQEALKLIHGMEVQSGCAMVFNGIANNFYITRLPRREDCLSHVFYDGIEDVRLSNQDTPEDVFRVVGRGTLQLDRELIVDLSCRSCQITREVFRPLAGVSMREGTCPRCTQPMAANIVHSIEPDSPLSRKKLSDLGVPCYDIIKVRAGGRVRFVRLVEDRGRALAEIA